MVGIQLVKLNKILILEIQRGKWDITDSIPKLKALYQQYSNFTMGAGASNTPPAVSDVYIETAGTGSIAVIDLIDREVPTKPITRTADKYTRALGTLGYLKTGQVLYPTRPIQWASRTEFLTQGSEVWLPDLRTEMNAFSADAKAYKHDDQVDCLVDLVNHLQHRSGSALAAMVEAKNVEVAKISTGQQNSPQPWGAPTA